MQLACGSKPVMPRHQPRRTERAGIRVSPAAGQPCAALAELAGARGILRLQIGSRSSRSAIGVSTRNRADRRPEARHWQFYIYVNWRRRRKVSRAAENKLQEFGRKKHRAICPARHEDQAAVEGQREAENRRIGEDREPAAPVGRPGADPDVRRSARAVEQGRPSSSTGTAEAGTGDIPRSYTGFRRRWATHRGEQEAPAVAQ